MYALVDCNCFFVSCERVFNPQLKNRPVVVLSNNDGAVISRSDEAKALGIKMGEAFFKIKHLVNNHKLQVRSSNFVLYGDMSTRVMYVLIELAPEIEIYSIDEAFLKFNSGLTEAYAHEIKKIVYQYTGIPTSIGFAPTKVLAKAANELAKTRKEFRGVCDLSDPQVQEEMLEKFPVGNVWGIGYKSAAKLKALGIFYAGQLRQMSEASARKLLTVVGLRIVMELRGISCLPKEADFSQKKQILRSRSFGKSVFTLEELREAVATHATNASERLRKQNSVCGCIVVFVETSRFKQDYYSNSATYRFSTSTNAVNLIIKGALIALEKIFKEGIEYKKAGVILSELSTSIQGVLFAEHNIQRDEHLSKVVDKINSKLGNQTIKIASCGLNPKWATRSEMRSPCYTTEWSELMTVK